MVDSRRDATYPRPAVGHGRFVRHFAGPAVSYCWTGASVAYGVLLGGDSATPLGASWSRQGRPSSDDSAERVAGISLRLSLVPRELLLDLSDDVSVWRAG